MFGKTTTTSVDLASMGAAGYRIDGAAEFDLAGTHVDGLGDLNDDGKSDVIVSATGADNNGRPESGSAYVVFGKSTTTSIDLASLGSGGYRIDGTDPGGPFHDLDVARAGDVNNDDIPDIALSNQYESNNSRHFSGSAWVAFGKADTTNLDLASLGSAGFRVDGAAADDQAGISISGLGDLNGDGFGDLLVGAPFTDYNSRFNSGSVYIELVADWLPGACANPRSGTDGDDTIVGSSAGDDIPGCEGHDDLSGEEGDDCVEGEGGQDTVKGGENVDVVKGGEGSDTVKGGDGDDPTVNGGDGNDTLDGGDGEDTVDGGNGSDDAQGGTNKDTIEGGEKNDTLEGEDGDDTLKGETGNDTLKGGENADTLKGGEGEDTLKGGAGGDTLEGGDNADTINGGDGQDTIEAGGGNDDIEADDGEKDTIKCGSGNDTVDADNKDELIGC